MDLTFILIFITAVILAGAFLLIEMLRQAKKLKIEYQDFFMSENDKENPVKIVLLTDIHVSRLPINWDYIGTMVSKENPDVIMLAGDYVYDPGEGPLALEFLQCFANFTDCPVYLTYENHDNKKTFGYSEEKKAAFTKEVESISPRFHVLDNESVETEFRGRKIRICGVGDYRTSDKETDRRNMPVKKDGYYSILLSHNPDILTYLPDGCADLGLFGHYHNGQVRLPFRTEFSILRRRDLLANKGYIYGKYDYRGTPIYISSGLGNANMPIRFMTEAEIAVIRI